MEVIEMKAVAGSLLGGSLVAVLLSPAWIDSTGGMKSLRARVGDSEERLREAQREISRLRREGERAAEIETQRAEQTAREVRRAMAQPVEALYRDVLAPSVQVVVQEDVGGGTILHSQEGRTFVITAFHVVQKAVPRNEHGPTRGTVDVRIYDGAPWTVPGEIETCDEKKDLALLRLRSDRAVPNVARLASRESLREVRVFTPVYAVGCPLGHDPLPTLGEVAALHKEVSGERFWMMNAPTIFGNSGGGIFHRETRELIGVSVMVCTYDGVVSTPVPHLGVLVSLDAVYDWLDSLGYGFVYGGAAESASRARPGLLQSAK